MLKVSVFYLEKQKSFIPFLGRSQYQNKKALFTDLIFSDGFVHENKENGIPFWKCFHMALEAHKIKFF